MSNEILTIAISCLISALVGWGVSQATIGKRVTEAIADMKVFMTQSVTDRQQLHRDISDLRNDTTNRTTEIQKDTTQRIQMMAELSRGIIEQASKLIDIVTIQNALLNRMEQERMENK